MAYSSAQKKLITATERERDRVQRMRTQALAARVSGYFAAQAATLERKFRDRGYELKGDPAAGDFLPDVAFVASVAEDEKLSKVVKSAVVDIAGSTFASVEATLGITAAFDLNSRNNKVMLDAVGNRVKGTNAESLDRLKATILRGIDGGMGPDTLARELVAQLKGWAGFEDLKRSRAMTIARTETANAYSLSSLNAYEDSGFIKEVICMDAPDCGWNGHNDSELANQTVRTIQEARKQPLSHPNCIRAFAPKVAGSKFVEAPGARKRGGGDEPPKGSFLPDGTKLPEPWRDTPSAKWTELVPTSLFDSIPRGNPVGKTDIPKLMDSIKEKGFQQPLQLTYSVKDRAVLLDEGNHRITAAKKLGVDNVPVTVFRVNGSLSKPGLKVPGIDPDEFGYVPGQLRPSQVLR